jgi:drug/metabolite transporter (DMT)-like permease
MAATELDSLHARTRAQHFAGIALLVGATMCFACIDSSAKYLNRTMAPMQTLTVRYLGSFLLVALLLNPRTKLGILRTSRPKLQIARGLGLVAASVCLFTALNFLPLTSTTSITFSAPLLVALLARPLLGETLGPRRLAAVIAGFFGVLVVTQPWTGSFHPAMGLALLCAGVTALYTIVTRILAVNDPPETTMFYTGLVGAIAVLPVVPFVWKTPASPQVWVAMGSMSLFGALGHWLLILAHKKAPASVVAPFFYAQLIWAVGLGALIFNERPDRWTLLGGGIVMSSGLYLLDRERRRHRPPSADVGV